MDEPVGSDSSTGSCGTGELLTGRQRGTIIVACDGRSQSVLDRVAEDASRYSSYIRPEKNAYYVSHSR